MRVVIVGAGVAGLSVAQALVARGVRPLVIAPDHGYTRNGAGVVTSTFWDAELAPFALRSQEILRKTVRVHRCPMAQIALSEDTARVLQRIEGAREGLPGALEAALAPEFRTRIVRAVHAREDFWVSPLEVLRAFAKGSDRSRARVLSIRGRRVETTRGTVEAEAVVVATGAWRIRSLPDGGVERRRAQLARSRAKAPAMLHVLDTGIYLRPSGAGLLVGDGDARWRGAPSDEASRATARFLRSTEARLSSMFRRPARCTAAPGGLVAMTPDRRPILRRLHIHDGETWLLCGFGGDGLSLAPAFGERLAEELLQNG